MIGHFCWAQGPISFAREAGEAQASEGASLSDPKGAGGALVNPCFFFFSGFIYGLMDWFKGKF